MISTFLLFALCQTPESNSVSLLSFADKHLLTVGFGVRSWPFTIAGQNELLNAVSVFNHGLLSLKSIPAERGSTNETIQITIPIPAP
jgi:hypothetical protein